MYKFYFFDENGNYTYDLELEEIIDESNCTMIPLPEEEGFYVWKNNEWTVEKRPESLEELKPFCPLPENPSNVKEEYMINKFKEWVGNDRNYRFYLKDGKYYLEEVHFDSDFLKEEERRDIMSDVKSKLSGGFDAVVRYDKLHFSFDSADEIDFLEKYILLSEGKVQMVLVSGIDVNGYIALKQIGKTDFNDLYLNHALPFKEQIMEEKIEKLQELEKKYYFSSNDEK